MKPSESRGKGNKHTVEDGTSEEHQELDEQALLLGTDLVPAHTLAAGLNIAVGDTLLDVGLEPLLWHDTSILVGGLAGAARSPELMQS